MAGLSSCFNFSIPWDKLYSKYLDYFMTLLLVSSGVAYAVDIKAPSGVDQEGHLTTITYVFVAIILFTAAINYTAAKSFNKHKHTDISLHHIARLGVFACIFVGLGAELLFVDAPAVDADLHYSKLALLLLFTIGVIFAEGFIYLEVEDFNGTDFAL